MVKINISMNTYNEKLHCFLKRINFRLVLFLIYIMTIPTLLSFSQVSINNDSSAPDNSAMLDIKSTNKGALLPRMNFQQRNAIQNPIEGLMVYCLNCSSDGTGVISIFQAGKWKILNLDCRIPNQPTSGIHLPDVTQIVWKWNKVPIADGYKWNVTSNYVTATDMGVDTSKVETGLSCNTSYIRYIWAYNACGNTTSRLLTQSTSSVSFAASPAEGIHTPGLYSIIWNWNPVIGATGYKWNTTENYGTAIDMNTSTTKTEIGLANGFSYNRFIWAYDACGPSAPTVLTQTTSTLSSCVPFTDARDGKFYNTVVIGSQCWMAQNLNFGTMINGAVSQSNNGIIEKYCNNDNEVNCSIYGGLYLWDEFMNYSSSSFNNPSGRQGICPFGWHVPSDVEFCQMETYIDVTVNCANMNWLGTDAGGKMKESGLSHWTTPNTGATNSSGFTALPGGDCTTGGFWNFSTMAYFWTASESSPSNGWYHFVSNSNAKVGRINIEKTLGFSVRCIKD